MDESNGANDSDHKGNEVNANALHGKDSRSQSQSQSQSSIFKTSVLNMRSYSVRHGRSGTSTSSVHGQGKKGNVTNKNTNFGDSQGRAKKTLLPRGVCYPTNISVNDVLCNYAPFR